MITALEVFAKSTWGCAKFVFGATRLAYKAGKMLAKGGWKSFKKGKKLGKGVLSVIRKSRTMAKNNIPSPSIIKSSLFTNSDSTNNSRNVSLNKSNIFIKNYK